MKRTLTLLSLCAALLFSAALAPGAKAYADTDISGNWTAELTTPDGNSFTLTYVFKVDAGKLTGTVQGPQGDPLALDNGKVDGDKVSFDVSFNGITINNEGTVSSADEIKLNTKASDGSFPPSAVTLKRVKPAAAPVPAAAPAAPSNLGGTTAPSR